MKKLLLLVVLLVLGTMTTFSQDFYLPEGITLTGRQYHYDGFSIMETDKKGQYLMISEGCEPSFETLAPFTYNGQYGPIREVRPYYYSNAMRWYIQTDYGRFIVWSDGSMSKIDWRPTYYRNYRYSCAGARFLNFLSWHYRHIPCIDYGHRRNSNYYHNNHNNSHYRNYDRGGRNSNYYDNNRRSSSGRSSSSYDNSGSSRRSSESVRSSVGSSSRSSGSSVRSSSGSSSRSSGTSSRSSSGSSGSSRRAN